ncbi:MAG: formylglycine-generating enzyme family protein [Bacteroides sp.]|nr:formylglycine-generating enzyme family protein [Bacteroides sp.]
MVNAETGVVQDSAEELLSDPTSAKLVAAAEKIAKGVVGNTTSSSSTGTVSSTDGNIETFTVNGVTFDMVKVNDTFSIGKTEVTQRLWRAVMGNNPSKFLGENSPVEMVSWYDCQEFCDKLSQLTGRIFRLPTEAEWLYAARGGEKSRGYEYSGSNDLYRVAWYTENSGQMTHPVGQKMPNELGIFDMSGNVWEWCSDLYDSSSRVNRGGGWSCNASGCRVASRDNNAPGNRGSDLGFRLAL